MCQRSFQLIKSRSIGYLYLVHPTVVHNSSEFASTRMVSSIFRQSESQCHESKLRITIHKVTGAPILFAFSQPFHKLGNDRNCAGVVDIVQEQHTPIDITNSIAQLIRQPVMGDHSRRKARNRREVPIRRIL